MANLVGAEETLALQGVWTHLAVADGPAEEDTAFTRRQLECFDACLVELAAAGHRPALIHTANSAGTIAYPDARRDLVRCGIAVYGELPHPDHQAALAEATGGGRLRPALSLQAGVSYVRELGTGSGRPMAGAVPYRSRRWWPPLRSGTPTGCPGACSNAVPGAGRGSPAPAGRHGHHGPDRHRLRAARADGAVIGDEVVLLGHQDDVP